MNLKKLFTLVAVFVVLIASSTFAQTTYYVDVQNGLDGYNGLSATVGGPGVGPKQTITNAIAAASDGDIISVAYANGNLYNEVVTVADGGVTKKLLTFTSTGGTPMVVSLTLNNTVASPNNTLTFTGPFKFSGGLTLTAGKIVGATNLTVGTPVTRTAGSVDSQLNFTGTVNFTYNGGAAITSGGELPDAANTTNFGSLTTVGATPLTLNTSKTMSGVLTTASTLAIGSANTLTINGANAHTVAGNVTNGTLAFSLTGAASVTGNFNLPAVTATSTAAQTLTLNTNTTIGNVTAGGVSTVAIPNAVTVGTLTNNGSGAITPAAATTIAGLSNTSSGNIVVTTVAAYTVTNNVSQSGSGFINFNGGAPSIGGNVTNNPTLTLTDAGVAGTKGYIAFTPNVAVVISGQLSVSTTLTGATGATGATNWTNNGEVRFLSTTANVTITGGVVISTTHSITYGGTGAPTVSTNGGVTLATTTGALAIGGVTISTNWPDIASTTDANNGSFTATARTTGTFGLIAAKTGAITNTSTASNGANGNFTTAATGNVGFFGTSVSTSGGAGGFITFGNESVNLSGSVTNSRTSAANHITFGTVPTIGATVSVGGNVENSGASTILFGAFNGAAAEAFAVNGTVRSTGTGTITVAATAPLTGTGAFTLGGVDLQSGTISLLGAGNGIMDVVVKGSGNFVGGTFDMGTSVVPTSTVNPVLIVGGDRILQLGGLVYQFSSATTSTNFSGNGNVVLYVQPTTIVSSQTITLAATTTVWPGLLIVDNQTGLQPAVTFSSGNFRALKDVAFNQSEVALNNSYIFVGGLLAPNVGAGDFYNWSGYTTTGQSFVSMNGNAAKNAGGTGTFENFEVDMAAGVTFAAATTFTKTFNLTNGAVTGGAFIVFNNSTNYPTIVRNAGTFAVAPTFTSKVNVYYIGLDKVTANELPTSATKLNDLTVATTNGAVAGKGTVNVGVATTVNGTLNIYPNQALLLNGVDLTMAGTTMILDGVLANVAAGDMLILANATGTTINGAGNGWLPDFQIKVGSVGNKITNVKGVVTTFLGGNNVWGTDDFDPTTTPATGSISFDPAAGAGSVDVAFGAGALNGTHFFNLTTVDAANVFTLSANTVGSAFAHVAGTIDVAGNTLTLLGIAQAMTEGATVVGTGTLYFKPAAAAVFTSTGVTAVNGPSLDVATVNVNTTAGNFALTGGELYVNGNLALNGTAGSFDITAGRTLTAAGQNVTLAAGTSFIATGATGVLLSDVTTGTQTLTATGAVAIANLTVADNLVLNLSGAGAAITIGTAFKHTAGQLDFSSFDLTISGTYTRTGGTYAATTGYLVINNAVMNQGATAFDIPNLRFTANSAATIAAQTGMITVTTALDIQQPGSVSIKSANTGNAVILTVATGATVNYKGVTASKFNAAPIYAGTVVFVSNLAASATLDASIWPTTLTASTLRINNSGGAAVVFTMPGDRTVGDVLDLRVGVLDLSAPTVLTVANNPSTVRRRQGGSVALGGGTLTYTTAPDVIYEGTAAFNTGAELPATVNTLTFTRSANAANSAVTLLSSVTVNNATTIKNNFTIPPAPPVITVTLMGSVSILNDAATYALATNPVLTNGQSLVIGGDGDQTVTVPSATPALNIGAITVNKASGNVIIAGGNLATGTITFTKGNIVTNAFILYIPAPTTGAVAGGAVSQGFTGAGAASMVVGNVAKTLVNTGGIGTSTESVNLFPVGTGVVYRPATVIFNPAFGVPTTPNATIVVNHVDSNPGGSSGLPIANGVAAGIDVSRYPAFYWNIYTIGSVGQSTIFDLGLTAGNFTDFDAPANVRIIRRHGAVGDVNNDWLLQGLNIGYDNEVNSTTGFTAINRNSVGGLRTGGAVFTLGVKSNISVKNPIAKQWLVIPQGAKTVSLANVFQGNIGTLSFSAQSSNPAVATAEIVGTSVKLTPLTTGEAVVTVTAVDAANNDFFAYSFPVDSRPTDVATTEEIPTEFALMQNFPNPFNPTTNIKFALPKESNVTLKIYNILGEEVANLINQVMPAGYHTYNFDATRLSSGMYIYRIEAGSFVQVKKMLLMK